MKKFNYIVTALCITIFTASCSANSTKNNSKDTVEEVNNTLKAENVNTPSKMEETNNSSETKQADNPVKSEEINSSSKIKNVVTSTKNEVQTLENSSVSHSSFDQLLKANVSSKGMVDYASFAKSKATLENYITSLSKVNTASLSKNEKLAFWINAYNALTIDQIIRNYPTTSILKIAGGKVWDQSLPYKFDGKTLTLNDIEKKILLGGDLFDARIHFAVNCAAVSCPTLQNKAYTADNIQSLLTSNTKAALANPAFNKISTSNASISRLFDWYKADFVKGEGSVTNFINKYSSTKINGNTKIDYLEYNWDLNSK